MKRLAAVLALVAAGCSGGDSTERDATTSPAPTAANTAPPARLLAYTKTKRDGEVWIARPDGTRPRRLAVGVAPDVSPDGRWVAFQRRRGDRYRPAYDLWVISATGGRARLLRRGIGLAPVWSPDSSRVAVQLHRGGRSSAVYVVDITTGNARLVAWGAVEGVSWSPSGRELAFGRAEVRADGSATERGDIFVVAADGGRPRRVTTDRGSTSPVWGRQGIAYLRFVVRKGLTRVGEVVRRDVLANEIRLIQPDGSGRRMLARTPRLWWGWGRQGLNPRFWSADGRTLVAELVFEGDGMAYVVDGETGRGRIIRCCTPEGVSRDGRHVLLSSLTGYAEYNARPTVETIRSDGGARRVLAREATEPSWNR